MLSICIPVYNCIVTTSVNTLNTQGQQLGWPFEIILIDDNSDQKYKSSNKSLQELPRVTYIELLQNHGRAKIRNLFLSYTSFDYLLFLDCDVKIHSATFLKKYINIISNTDAQILCGGHIYESAPPSPKTSLRWKYGVKKEVKPLAERKRFPNRSFITKNFIIKRSLLRQVRFDERLTNYGHEDTLFGLQLTKHNIQIHHIDNPVLNIHLESNAEFLAKTKEGIHNLIFISKQLGENSGLQKEITLINAYYTLKNYKLAKPFGILFTLIQPLLELYIKTGGTNLFCFDFYKLGYICKVVFLSNPR